MVGTNGPSRSALNIYLIEFAPSAWQWLTGLSVYSTILYSTTLYTIQHTAHICTLLTIQLSGALRAHLRLAELRQACIRVQTGLCGTDCHSIGSCGTCTIYIQVRIYMYACGEKHLGEHILRKRHLWQPESGTTASDRPKPYRISRQSPPYAQVYLAHSKSTLWALPGQNPG